MELKTGQRVILFGTISDQIGTDRHLVVIGSSQVIVKDIECHELPEGDATLKLTRHDNVFRVADKP